MLGSDTLLFPDTGPAFLRALRTSALYSRSISALTLFDASGRMELLEKLSALLNRFPGSQSTISEYSQFITTTGQELALFESEGILRPVGYTALTSMMTDATLRGQILDEIGGAVEQLTEGASAAIESVRPDVDHVRNACPASLFHLVEQLLPALSAFMSMTGQPKKEMSTLYSILGDEDLSNALFMTYVLLLLYFSEQKGLTVTTWIPEFQNLIWKLSGAMQDSSKLGRAERRQIATRSLGTLVIERHLPRVDDLPAEEILAIRDRYSSELTAFQIGLAEAATEIDLSRSFEELSPQLNDLVARQIDPAVEDLRAALKIARLNALKKLFSANWEKLAGMFVGFGFAATAGTPTQDTVASGLVGTAVASLLSWRAESEIEQSKALAASRWSILIRLEE